MDTNFAIAITAITSITITGLVVVARDPRLAELIAGLAKDLLRAVFRSR